MQIAMICASLRRDVEFSPSRRCSQELAAGLMSRLKFVDFSPTESLGNFTNLCRFFRAGKQGNNPGVS
jgi:hypothetical protein